MDREADEFLPSPCLKFVVRARRIFVYSDAEWAVIKCLAGDTSDKNVFVSGVSSLRQRLELLAASACELTDQIEAGKFKRRRDALRTMAGGSVHLIEQWKEGSKESDFVQASITFSSDKIEETYKV